MNDFEKAQRRLIKIKEELISETWQKEMHYSIDAKLKSQFASFLINSDLDDIEKEVLIKIVNTIYVDGLNSDPL